MYYHTHEVTVEEEINNLVQTRCLELRKIQGPSSDTKELNFYVQGI